MRCEEERDCAHSAQATEGPSSHTSRACAHRARVRAQSKLENPTHHSQCIPSAHHPTLPRRACTYAHPISIKIHTTSTLEEMCRGGAQGCAPPTTSLKLPLCRGGRERGRVGGRNTGVQRCPDRGNTGVQPKRCPVGRH